MQPVRLMRNKLYGILSKMFSFFVLRVAYGECVTHIVYVFVFSYTVFGSELHVKSV